MSKNSLKHCAEPNRSQEKAIDFFPTYRKFSGLRTLVLSLVGATFLILFVGQFVIARMILLHNFAILEEEKARTDGKKLHKILSNQISQLNHTVADWAHWDETYNFAKNQNSTYLTQELTDPTLENLQFNLFLVVDNSEKVVFGQLLGLPNKGRKALSPSQIALLYHNNELLSHSDPRSGIKGIFLFEKKPILVSSWPILTSELQGPPAGTLIVGRCLDDTKIEKISETAQQPVSLHLYNDPALPANFQSIKEKFTKNNTIVVEALDEKTIATYVLIENIFGKPTLILSTKGDRNIYAEVQKTLSYYFWSTLAIGSVFYLLISLLLEKLILSRLGYLTQEVGKIGTTGNLSARILLTGQDELSNLGNTINSTLKKLEQFQQALKESEERYALAVVGANDGIWDWNLRTDQIYLSPRWLVILGHEEKEIYLSQEDFFQLVHPHDVKQLKRAIADHLENKTPHLQHEYRTRNKDNSYRWVLCRGLAVRDDREKPYRMAGSLTDITERKLAEEEISRQKEELARSNAELEQFAYIASHDLQEPLRKIESFGDRLKTKCASDLSPKGREYLERMNNATGRMRILIQDLLALSRVTTTAQPFVPVNLNRVVRDVISDLEARIQETGGRVQVDNLPTIEAEPIQMRQLFQNLIGNALKFRSENKRPSVRINATMVSPSTTCEIVVMDNGIGFDEKYSDRIFKIFQRLHSRSEYEGTGIGLAICAKIVERHGGWINVKSKPGFGSAFIITLPIKQNQKDTDL